MRGNTSDHGFNQTGERSVDVRSSEQGLLTPARRAALDALEREFYDLLQNAQLTRAA